MEFVMQQCSELSNLYIASQKLPLFYFWNTSVKSQPIVMVFGILKNKNHQHIDLPTMGCRIWTSATLHNYATELANAITDRASLFPTITFYSTAYTDLRCSVLRATDV